MRKLRMSVHNEGVQVQSIKLNSVSNASIVILGDADLLTPQTQTILQQVPGPQGAQQQQPQQQASVTRNQKQP